MATIYPTTLIKDLPHDSNVAVFGKVGYQNNMWTINDGTRDLELKGNTKNLQPGKFVEVRGMLHQDERFETEDISFFEDTDADIDLQVYVQVMELAKNYANEDIEAFSN